ncbi:hypothetical protein ACFXPA_12520 [Amycolatopsis sp. NPDC059090]|uniref:hypothetical protein n=1 Tax=unclassified Amycolatopsis TaxID=2618356 RepID=UPI003670AA9C
MPFDDLDFSPFTDRVDPASARAYAVANGERPGADLAAGGCAVTGLSVLFFGFFSVFFGMMSGGFLTAGGLAPAGIGVAVVVFFLVSSGKGGRHGRETSYRIMRFATVNGMGFRKKISDPGGAGTIFGVGLSRTSSDVVALESPREIEIGQHAYYAGYRSGERHRWSYATTPLDAELPHLIVMTRATTGRPRLPGSDTTPGNPELHGPGADAFRVFGPIGRAKEIQALLDRTVFAPDLLPRLLERPLDVELVDARLYLYSAAPLSTAEPDTWRWILPLITDLAERLERF